MTDDTTSERDRIVARVADDMVFAREREFVRMGGRSARNMVSAGVVNASRDATTPRLDAKAAEGYVAGLEAAALDPTHPAYALSISLLAELEADDVEDDGCMRPPSDSL